MVKPRPSRPITVASALVPALLMSALGVWLFVEILDAVLERDSFTGVDESLATWLPAHRFAWLTTTLTVITNIFGPVVLPILVMVACSVWGWRTREWRDPVLLASAMVLSTVISVVVKALVQRPRPDESLQVIPGFETSYSFPSGHSTGTSTLVLVTAYLLWRRERHERALVAWMAVSIVLIALVGGSRLYLGYHFLSDVLAGVCLGVFTLGLVVGVDRWLSLKHQPPL